MSAKLDAAAAAEAPAPIVTEQPAPVVDSTVAEVADPPVVEDAGTADTDQPGDALESDEGEGKDDEPNEPVDEFTSALAKSGLAVTLEDMDLTPEVRAGVEAKLRAMSAGFTKLRQRDRAAMKDVVTARAELRFQKERPADFILQQLTANPALADEVNAKLDELAGSSIAREHHAVVVEDARKKATAAELSESEREDRLAEAMQTIGDLAEKAARKHGVPMSLGVQDGIDAHIAKHGDITAADINTIAEAKGKAYQASLRARAREADKVRVKDKVDDRRTAGLVIKPGTGAAPAPGAPPKITNDQQFHDHMVAKLNALAASR